MLPTFSETGGMATGEVVEGDAMVRLQQLVARVRCVSKDVTRELYRERLHAKMVGRISCSHSLDDGVSHYAICAGAGPEATPNPHGQQLHVRGII